MTILRYLAPAVGYGVVSDWRRLPLEYHTYLVLMINLDPSQQDIVCKAQNVPVIPGKGVFEQFLLLFII